MTKKNRIKIPSLEEASELYRLAESIKELAPWEWMDESEIFGVQSPETGELGFVSIMGMAGEHFAIAIYLGAEGLYGILDFAFQENMTRPDQLLDIPQLQTSFEDRDILEKQDRDVIKKLGLKFRGANAWPMFRSYRPGFMPWLVTAEEGCIIKHALEQTLEVAPRVKDDPEILNDAGDEEGEVYLVRVPRQDGAGLVWEDQMMRVPPPEPESLIIEWDAELLSTLKQLPQRPLEAEIELLSLPVSIGEKDERPSRPYMLMMADSASGMIIGFELMHPDPSLAEMHKQVPLKVAEWLAQAGVIPKGITARSEIVLELLEPLAETFKINLYQADELPSIDGAASSIFGGMMNLEI